MVRDNTIGWMMAWLPEGATHFNFDFFQEKDADGELIKYNVSNGNEWQENIAANRRADIELQWLKENKLTKYGTKVVDGYIFPVKNL